MTTEKNKASDRRLGLKASARGFSLKAKVKKLNVSESTWLRLRKQHRGLGDSFDAVIGRVLLAQTALQSLDVEGRQGRAETEETIVCVTCGYAGPASEFNVIIGHELGSQRPTWVVHCNDEDACRKRYREAHR